MALNEKVLRIRRADVSPDRLRQMFEYDPERGFIFWKIEPNFKKLKGKRAGCVGAGGYRQIRIGGVTYKETRIIWAMQTGAWPEHHIDHANNRRDDNRWHNLREATAAQNRQNTLGKIPGIKGVSACNRKYRARIKVAGKTRHLGTFESPTDAAKAYLAAAKSEYGEFARIA